MIIKILIFLLLNFAALAVGGLFTGNGVASDWYSNLAKAPWTPPGWVFGVAWTTIMILFSIYMSYAWSVKENKNELILLFSIQWILNVSWNPTFFYYHQVFLALLVICLLTVLIGYILFLYWQTIGFKSILIAPYLIWLLIATSLNAYVLFKN